MQLLNMYIFTMTLYIKLKLHQFTIIHVCVQTFNTGDIKSWVTKAISGMDIHCHNMLCFNFYNTNLFYDNN